MIKLYKFNHKRSKVLMNYFRSIFVLLMICFIQELNAQTIIPGGYVSGNWTASASPYLIQDDILIHPDSTLIIEAGTSVLFFSKKMLEIQGQLIVSGTTDEPVHFDGDQDTTTWYGIFFNTTDTSITDSSILQHGFISHCNSHPAITIDQSSRLRISGFTMQFNEVFRGGGISCINSGPVLENLLVYLNQALDGGGISLENSDAVFKNCIISQNAAGGAGGGIVIFGGSNAVFENCVFIGNISLGSGGGIYINDSDPVFRNCNISGNEGAIGASTLYSGGGVSVKLSSNPVFENCIFENNMSHREGGGIASFSENEIINCLFKENYAAVKGGGAFLSSGNLIVSHLTNCTFADNDSPQGTALADRNHTGYLRNCILWHSNPTIPSSLIYLESSFSLNVLNAGYCDIQNGQAGIEVSGSADYIWNLGNIDADPQFLPDTCDLSWQSPCIEAGTPDTSGYNLPEFDLAGNPRFANERIDIGAYEYQLALEIPGSIRQPADQIPKEVLVFPNPAQEWIRIDFERPIKNARFRILSIDGNILMEEILVHDNSCTIDLKGFASGIYLIDLKADNYFYTEKLIISK
jgi:hypothetical protein